MVKTQDIGITVYELLVDGKRLIKVQASFALDGMNLEHDEIGVLKQTSKDALQKALKEALSKWEFENV